MPYEMCHQEMRNAFKRLQLKEDAWYGAEGVDGLIQHIPFQIGPTCSPHCITDTVEYRYRLAFDKLGITVPFKRLAVQYCVDAKMFLERDEMYGSKGSLINLCCELGDMGGRGGGGLIDCGDYCREKRGRGEGKWTKSSFKAREVNVPRFPVMKGQILSNFSRNTEKKIETIREGLRGGPVYAVFHIYPGYFGHQDKKDYCDHAHGEPHGSYKPSDEEVESGWATHAILLIGTGVCYDETKNRQRRYFVYRNSYGDKCGTNGYMRIWVDCLEFAWIPVLSEKILDHYSPSVGDDRGKETHMGDNRGRPGDDSEGRSRKTARHEQGGSSSGRSGHIVAESGYVVAEGLDQNPGCLAPLVKKIHEAQVLEKTNKLCDKLLNGKDQHRDIASIAVKTIFSEVPSSVAQSVLVSVSPKLIKGITSPDISWKVRRASAKCLAGFIVFRPKMLTKLSDEACPKLTNRFKEREENVKMDVFSTFIELLRQTGNVTKRQTDINELSLRWSLKQGLPKIVKSISRKLSKNSIRTKIGAFSVVKELVVVLPYCLGDHIRSLIPRIEKVLCDKSSTSNLKIEALVFTRLVLAFHSPAVFHPYIKAIFAPVLSAVSGHYYKVTAEALKVSEELVRVVHPNIEVIGFDFKPHAHPIYNAIMTRLTNQDQDQEVEECAISCMGLVVSTFGDNLRAELPSCLPVLVDRMGNEITRLTAVKGNLALRQATLVTLNTLIVAYGDKIGSAAYEVIIVEHLTLISDLELHMTALALELCCALMSDRRSNPNFGLSVRNKLLPQALTLVKMLTDIVKDDSTTNSAKQHLALLLLGEIGSRKDLSSHAHIENIIIESFQSPFDNQHKKQSLLLHSLKEVIVRQSVDKADFQDSSVEKEGVRNVVAERLGKFALIKPAKLVPALKERTTNSAAFTRATVVVAVKQSIVERPEKIDEILYPVISSFLILIKDHDRQELIRTVALGHFKHIVDDGLEMRKAAFECVDSFLDSCLDQVNPSSFIVPYLTSGLDDPYDVKMPWPSYPLNTCGECPPAVLAVLDSVVDPLQKIGNIRPKQDAVKQEVDRNEDMIRSALRAITSLDRISGGDCNHKFKSLMPETAKSKTQSLALQQALTWTMYISSVFHIYIVQALACTFLACAQCLVT